MIDLDDGRLALSKSFRQSTDTGFSVSDLKGRSMQR